jgi:hypothetical protein
MCNLQVEELEPRQLLSGTSFSPQPPSLSFAADGTGAARVAERLSFVANGGHSGPVQQGKSGEGGAMVGPSGSPSLFDGRDPSAFRLHESVPSNPGAARLVAGNRDTFWVGADHPGADLDAARGSETARTIAGALLLVPAKPATSSHWTSGTAAEFLLGIPAERLNSQHPSHLENSVDAPGSRDEVQGFAAVRYAVWAATAKAGVFGAAANLGKESLERHINTSGTSVAPEAKEESVLPSPQVSDARTVLPPFNLSALGLGMRLFLGRVERQVLPSPQVSGVLTVLPPFDLTALGPAMQQFLEQVEGLGQRLADQHGIGLYPWIVAVVAAATACEIARRQLRPHTGGLAMETNGMSGSLPGPPFAG